MSHAAVSYDEQLIADIGDYACDPLGFVMYAYDWRDDPELQVVKLDDHWAKIYDCEYGPDRWACEELEHIGEEMRSREFDGRTPVKPIQVAIRSGHGIGKSTFTGWLVDHIMSCWPGSQGIVTANTGPQLQTKTFARIAWWTKRCITAPWFQVSAGQMWVRGVEDPENWKCNGVTWRKEQAEAFAGLHAATAIPFYILDEASGIDAEIWEVAQGGLTDGMPMFFAFGNPTRNDGQFFNCFHKDSHRFHTREVDSRTCQLPNKAKIKEWIDDYGEDSDFVRIRVLGKEPRRSQLQFIPSDVVSAARITEARMLPSDPVIMGLDPARDGGCESALCVRAGFDARTFGIQTWRLDDTMNLVGIVTQVEEDLRLRGLTVAARFIDAHGMGAPVMDRLNQLGYGWIPVHNNRLPPRAGGDHGQVDALCWARVAEWMKAGGAIPDDDILDSQLTSRQYTFDKLNRLLLEDKDTLEKRGLESPDRADALALTFAQPVKSLDVAALQGPAQKVLHDFDPHMEVN